MGFNRPYIYGVYTVIYGENRIWTVYEPYMFEGVKMLQAFEGLRISDFWHNLLIHQFLCFIVMEGNVNGSSGGPGGGGASEVTAVTASATSSAVAAGRFLSAHVTSCTTERNWSLFGNIFSKTRNRLHLEKAQKLAFIRANSSLGQAGGLDEEIRFPD